MREIDRRTFLKASGGALLGTSTLLSLLSCGTGQSGGRAASRASGTAAPSASAGDGGRSPATTLRFSHDKPGLDQQIAAESKAVANATGVGWNMDLHASQDAYASYINQSLGTAQAPDLFSWWSAWPLWQLEASGKLDDLSGIWSPVKSQFIFPLESPVPRQANQISGVPLDFSFYVTYYNKHIFSKLGLQPPTSWSEMQHVMDTLRGNGITPLGAAADGWPTSIYFQTLLSNSDLDTYQNLLFAQAKFTDDVVVEAMNVWADLIRKGNFTSPGADPIQQFQQGKCGMLQMASWVEPTLAKAGLQLDRDFSAFIWPKFKPDADPCVAFELAMIAVPASSPRRQQARESLGWFLSKAGQDLWVKSAQLTSPRYDVRSWSDIDVKIVEQTRQGDHRWTYRFWDGMPPEIGQFATAQFATFMRDPSNPQAILKSIQAKADEVWPKVLASVGG